MRNAILLASTILTLSLGFSSRGDAQWVHPGPWGGTVTSFASSGNDLYVSTRSGGVFRSSDSGLSWTHASTGLTDSSVALVAAFGPIVLAETDTSGLFRSMDEGSHWSQAGNGLPVYIPHYDPVSFAAIGTIIFAASDSGIYRSIDDGLDWSSINAGLPQIPFYSAMLASTDTLLYFSNGDQVFRSVDSGAVWVNVSKGISNPNGYLLSDLQARDSLVFAASDRGLFRSSDQGRNWELVSAGKIDGQFFGLDRLFLIDTVLYGTVRAGYNQLVILRSTDNGTNWTLIDSGTVLTGGPGFDTSISKPYPAHFGPILFAGDVDGVLRSPDGGATWGQSNNGIYLYDTGYKILNPVAYLGNRLIAKGDSLYVSTNLGVSWARYDALNGYRVNDVTTLGRFAFVATDSEGILRSSDFGTTWTVLDGMTNVYPVTSFAIGEGIIYAATNGGGIFRSVDSGNTWVPIKSDYPQSDVAATGNEVFAIFSDVYSITYQDIFRSTNSGNTWTKLPQPGGNVGVSQIWSNRNFVFLGPNLYRSPIDTDTWQGILHSPQQSNLHLVTDSLLFACSEGVFVSSDNGDHWDTAGLTKYGVNSLLDADGYIFAGTNVGLWHRPLSDFPPGPPASVSFHVVNSSEFICYPNPTTNLLHIESTSNDIIITDLLGRLWLHSTNGSHDFDVNNLPQGVYYVSDGTSWTQFVKE